MATLTAPAIEDLLFNVRNILNQPNANNSFWTDEELTAYLNEAVRRYFAEVVLSSEGQFVAQTDIDITANSETVALPSDCFEVKALYRAVAGGYVMLPYRNNLTEGYSNVNSAMGDLYLPYYYFRSTNLVLRPVPTFSETAGLRLEYIQFPATMLTGGDSLTTEVSPVFRDLIEAYAVYKATLKEARGSGNAAGLTVAKDNLNDLYTAFREVIHQRSHGPIAIKPFNPEDTF